MQSLRKPEQTPEPECPPHMLETPATNPLVTGIVLAVITLIAIVILRFMSCG